MYKKGDARADYCFAHQTYCFFMFLLTSPSSLLKLPFRACLHAGGGLQVGQVTRLGGVTRLSIKSLNSIWSRLHDRWRYPPHVTSPTWGPPTSMQKGP